MIITACTASCFLQLYTRLNMSYFLASLNAERMLWQAEFCKYISHSFILYFLLLVTCREILRTVVKEKDYGVNLVTLASKLM